MSDGISEQANRPPRRGHKLRSEKNYSAEHDYAIGSTSLNSRPRLDESQLNHKLGGAKLRARKGLIFKEAL